MCGFAGVINLEGHAFDRQERLAHLHAMSSQLSRRGPDDEQFYDDDRLSFVFRRLSIVDVEGGRQPFWNEDRSVLAAVNGEIYNHESLRASLRGKHEFETRSDCEVVVHLYEEYGEEFAKHLNGMFAILIWDTRAGRLLLIRDRLGIKPLHYAEIGDTLLFASELKALLVHPLCPRDFDWPGIGLRDRWAHAVPSYVRGVSVLLGGHRLKVAEEGGIASPICWWSIEDHLDSSGPDVDADALVHRYGDLLDESVRMRLMSDVPVGIFLSGGIDSSLLTGIAAGSSRNLHCFTVVEETTVKVGDVEQAKRITDRLGLPFHPVRFGWDTVVDELDFDLSQFEFLIWLMETPRFNVEWLMKHELHRFARTKVPDIKVMLLGQGADEFAGGYSLSEGVQRSWARYIDQLRAAVRREEYTAMGVPARLLPFVSAARKPAGGGRESTFFSEMRRRIYTLQRYNLWHEDRTASAQGIESRVPFLDHRLVELLASVPAELHEKLFYNKHIVRRQLARHLPDYPAEKLKVRFTTTGSEITPYRMLQRVLRKIYPAFREKYLLKGNAVFSDARLSGLAGRATGSGRILKQEVDFVFECMAIAVFDDLCHNLIRRGAPAGVNPPSPLRPASDRDLQVGAA